MTKTIDETNNRYGRLVVIKIEPERNKHNKTVWLCKCDCGNEAFVSGSNLRRGLTKSCGCLRRETSKIKHKFIDETGRIFGELTVVERAKNTLRGNTQWRCKCSCGNEIIARASNLRGKITKSCGCLIALPQGEATFRDLYRRYEHGAIRRGLEFAIPREEFRRLTKSNCYYCGTSPTLIVKRPDCNGDYTYNGLDRIQNDKGYTTTNVVPCCATCNFAKHAMSVPEFRLWITKIHQHLTETEW